MAQGKTASVIAAALLAGCSVYGSEPSIRPVRDVGTGHPAPGLWIVNTGDQGSGPIQSLVLQQRYRNGPIDTIAHASGPGTFQTFTEGGLSGLAIGAGTAGFGALLRPSTTAFSNIGNSRANAEGGKANASAVARQRQGQRQTQHQRATATSDAAASTGPIDVRGGGGIIPNGTILHTPGGDIVVDPTVTVSQ